MWLFPGPGAAPGSPVAGEQWALLHSPEWLSGSMWDTNGKRAWERIFTSFSLFFFFTVCSTVFILYHLWCNQISTPTCTLPLPLSLFIHPSFLAPFFFFLGEIVALDFAALEFAKSCMLFCAQPFSSVFSCVRYSRAISWGLRPLFSEQGLHDFLLSALRCSVSQRCLCVF